MITLIGVGHVFAISDQVRELIVSRRPEVVCLELDRARYGALLEGLKGGQRRVPLQYMLLARIQKRMADQFGSEAGAEMLAAARAAGEVGAKVALIDMDATAVFGRLWRAMPVKEKARLMFGALVGLVASKETVEKEMGLYEGHEAEYMETLGDQFPSIKRVLIDERNTYMARRLASIAGQHERVLAVVGDGHLQGLVEELGAEGTEVVRLKDLRNMDVTPPSTGGEYGFSYYLRD